MKDKVSIITPVYNGELYIERYIDSVVNQTYDNIELIIIDDGSKDLTKSKIDKYLNTNQKIDIKYIYQENGGQASAVANGIKYVTGDYLVWADSDDYFENNAIQKMVEVFINNPEADIVRGNAVARNEKNTNEILHYMNVLKEYQSLKNIFENAIFIQGINSFVGVYMVRFEKYKQNNPNLYIYPGREGQNWQLLLPAAYNNKCYYLNEIVYNYVVREDSHSHNKRSLEKQIERYEGLRKILKETLKMLKLEKEYRESLYKRIDEEYDKKLYMIYCKKGEKIKVKEYYSKINDRDIKMYLAYFVGTNDILRKIYILLRREKEC